MALDFQSMTLDDYLDLLSRKKKIVILLFFLFLVIGTIILFFIPKMYTSKTLVKVKDWPAIGQAYGGLLKAPFLEKLETLEEDLRSRDRLFEIIDQLHMADSLKTSKEREDLRKKIDKLLKIKLAKKGENEQTFTLTFEWYDPKLAADFVRTMRETYFEHNLAQYRGSIQEAKDKTFDQKKSMEQSFQSKQNELVKFEKENQNILSGEEPLYVKLREALEEELNEKEKQRKALQKKLEVIKDQIKSTERTTREVTRIPNKQRQQILDEIAKVDKVLIQLRQRFTDEWPVVKRYLNQKTELENMLLVVPDKEESEEMERINPAYSQLEIERNNIESTIPALDEEISNLLEKIDEYDDVIASIPEVMKNHANRKAELEALDEELKKIRGEATQASLSWDKVRELSRNLYEVMEEAIPSTEASSPDMLFGVVVVISVSFGLALMLVFAAEFFSKSIATIEEAKRFLTIPILGAIDVLLSEKEKRRRRRRKVAIVLSSVTVVLIGMTILFLYVRYPQYLPAILRNVLTDIKEVIIQPGA